MLTLIVREGARLDFSLTIVKEIPFALAGKNYQTLVAASGGVSREAIWAQSEAIAAYAVTEGPVRPKLAVFDTDSTFIDQEVIDEIAAFAGFRKEVSEITERAMQGELDFNSALKERVALLKGLKVEVLRDVKASALHLTQGARDLTQRLHERGVKTYLLSGGFSYFTSAFRAELGLTGDFANELEVADGKLTGRTLGRIVNRERKAELLRELAEKHGCNLSETIAVGDGANDIDMAQASGLGIAFCAKPALRMATNAAIFERDLRLVDHLIWS